MGVINQTNWLDFVTAMGAIGALIASLGGLLVSIRTMLIHKRQTYVSIFSNSRIDWVKCLRAKLAEFLRAYLKESEEIPSMRHKTIALKYEIELYMDYQKNTSGKMNDDYIKLSNRLDKYLEAPAEEPIINHTLLVEDSQKVLASAFLRAKQEAGITERMESRYWNKIMESSGVENNN
ncbi:MAG: hypothetical protein ACOXZ0_00045 [Eubacteriales bacterium]|jgi:hypothetical protein